MKSFTYSRIVPKQTVIKVNSKSPSPSKFSVFLGFPTKILLNSIKMDYQYSSLVLCSYFFASGSRLDQAGFGERLVSSNNLYVLHSRVALLQEGSQLGVGGLGRRKSRRCLGCSVRLRFGRSWLGLLLGLGPTFGHHSERVPLPPVHQRAWGRHSQGQLHFNIIDVCDGKLFA